MKFHNKTPFLLLAVSAGSLIGLSNLANAANLVITNVISQTVGTSAELVAPTASGTDANTVPWTVGTVGVFEMNNGAYYMRVNATNPTGGVAAANDSLMVARTVNSQGLTDTGTLSVYVRPSPLTNTEWSLDLNFSFFSDLGMTIPAPLQLQLTSLDIDFNQRYFTSSDDFNANVMANNTLLTTPGSVPTGYTGFTASGDSTYNNAQFAVASVGQGSSFDIRLAHNAVALFMFEFRTPSSITGLVPEPSSTLLILGGFSLFGLIRRRSHAA